MWIYRKIEKLLFQRVKRFSLLEEVAMVYRCLGDGHGIAAMEMAMVYCCHAAPVSTVLSAADEMGMSKSKYFPSQDEEPFVSCRYVCWLFGKAVSGRGYGYLFQHLCYIVAWPV